MKIVIADKDSVGNDMDYSIYEELGDVTYYDDKVTEENAKEQYEMDIDGLNVPSPDEYPGPAVQDQINQGNNNQPNNIYGEIPLNEQALEELIEKEEESLTKKENSQMKGLEEIKTNLKSLNSFFTNIKNSLYEEEFYADLKMKISK